MTQQPGSCVSRKRRDQGRRASVSYRGVLVGILIVLLGMAFGRVPVTGAAAVPEQIVIGVPNDIVSLDPEAQAELAERGVRRDRVEMVGGCTRCRPDLYFSWRGERTRSRMVSWITAKPSVSR